MSWEFVKGLAAKEKVIEKKCVFLDGVNDLLSLGNTSFYNVGTTPFSVAIRFMLPYYSGNGARSLYRTSSSQSAPRFLINTDSTNMYLGFSSDSSKAKRINFSDFIEYGKWITLVVIRTGTNSDTKLQPGWLNSIRNPDTYKVYKNGVLQEYSSLSELNLELPTELDNSEEKLLGGRTDSSLFNLRVYYDLFSIYDRQLTENEITLLMEENVLPDYMSKGIFSFDGDTSDSSSVGGGMILLNSATEDYITWPYTRGVICFSAGVSNQIKVFKYPKGVLVKTIWKEFNSYNGFQYSINSGTTWANILDGEYVEFNILVPANTELWIKDPTSRLSNNVLHLDFE